MRTFSKSLLVLLVCSLVGFVGAACSGLLDAGTVEKQPSKEPKKVSDGKDGKDNEKSEAIVCVNGDVCKPYSLYCLEDPADSSRKICREGLKNSGDSCEEDSECQDGSCFKLGEFYGRGGYCSRKGCNDASDCASSRPNRGLRSACLKKVDGSSFCASTCVRYRDCREGYFCSKSEDEERGVCLPTSETPISPQFEGEECKRVSLGETAVFNYNVPPDVVSYHVSGRVKGRRDDSTMIFPGFLQTGKRKYRMTMPILGTHYLARGKYAVIGDTSYYSPGIITFQVPHSPDYKKMLTPGEEVSVGVNLQSDRQKSVDVCIKFTPKYKVGKALDLNIYFVGVPEGLTVKNAATDEEFQKVIRRVRSIYQSKGITIAKIRYLDVSEETKRRFRIFRYDDNAAPLLADLVSTTIDPSSLGANSNSLNVFLVETIIGSAEGLSSGVPGLPGVHGMPGTGVVLTTEHIGKPSPYGSGTGLDGALYTAVAMAHEIGHFLGLSHTTEKDGVTVDPISDTPRCSYEIMKKADLLKCPDYENLMFPSADYKIPVISDGQAYVISRNPLVY